LAPAVVDPVWLSNEGHDDVAIGGFVENDLGVARDHDLA